MIPKVADFLVKITRQNKNIETMCDQGFVHHCRLFGKACEKPSPKSKFILNSLDGIVFALKEFSCLFIADEGALACAAAGNLGLDRQPHSRLPGSMRERMIQKQLPAFG
jgi:hypothetical protein